MKIKFLFIPIILLAFACQNTPKENTEQAQEATEATEEVVLANAQKVEINISGMTCTGCENAIQETINAFEGVYSTKADHEKGIATLEMDSTKMIIDDIKAAIVELGYEATDHNVLSE